MKFIVIVLFLFSSLFALSQDSSKVNADTSKKFKSYGVVSGLFFGDYASKFHADDLKRGNFEYSGQEKGFNAFNIRRVYLNYDYYFSEKFQTQVVLTYEGFTPVSSTRNIFVKYMNLRWNNIFKGSDLVFGQQLTPTFAVMERAWGYRFVEKTIADQQALSAASDLGISLQGKLGKAQAVGYTVMIGNGTGTRPEADKYKKIYTNLNWLLAQKSLTVDLVANYEDVNPGLKIAKELFKIGLAYQWKTARVGGEILWDKGIHTINTFTVAGLDTIRQTANQKSFGFSIFVTNNWSSKLSSFLRFDHFNPDENFSVDKRYLSPYNFSSDAFFTAGFDFRPIDRIHFSPNVWYNHFHHKQNLPNGNNFDLIGRLTVYVIFK